MNHDVITNHIYHCFITCRDTIIMDVVQTLANLKIVGDDWINKLFKASILASSEEKKFSHFLDRQQWPQEMSQIRQNLLKDIVMDKDLETNSSSPALLKSLIATYSRWFPMISAQKLRLFQKFLQLHIELEKQLTNNPSSAPGTLNERQEKVNLADQHWFSNEPGAQPLPASEIQADKKNKHKVTQPVLIALISTESVSKTIMVKSNLQRRYIDVYDDCCWKFRIAPISDTIIWRVWWWLSGGRREKTNSVENNHSQLQYLVISTHNMSWETIKTEMWTDGFVKMNFIMTEQEDQDRSLPYDEIRVPKLMTKNFLQEKVMIDYVLLSQAPGLHPSGSLPHF